MMPPIMSTASSLSWAAGTPAGQSAAHPMIPTLAFLMGALENQGGVGQRYLIRAQT
jgi:hypothetical protein